MKTRFIYETIARMFDEPCSFTFDGREVSDVMSHDWCEKHCGQETWKCWKEYFEALERERIDEVLAEAKKARGV